MTKKRSRSSRSVLIILALFLAASGALRLGDGIGFALANSTTQPADSAATGQDCPAPPAALAEALRQRDSDISVREQRLNQREAALALAEAAFSARMTEMQAAEDELKKTLKLADGAAEEDLKRLTAVYEAMKPADAAKLFSTMAPEFAAGFLGRMTPESAALVLSGMAPDRAYSISVLIAGRNALVPKN
jgi:flagellar motility protein MotE (MotC chaperone)